MRTFVVKGNLCFSRSMDELALMEHSHIVVEDGRVAGVFRTLPERYAQLPVLDYGEPDGPTRKTNSPSSIFMEMPFSAIVPVS